ncbi:MAG: signal recognition particle-docking protein FtsY [Holosporales bacterium]|jgi:fused signal recognition particle receptor|nr:signal recognition particle-docking protein FtsY [Holosporales bacterium]
MSGYFSRLKQAVSRTSEKITSDLSNIVFRKKINQQILDELEELLITSDVDPTTASEIVKDFAKQKVGQESSLSEVKKIFSKKILEIISPYEGALDNLTSTSAQRPYVILLCGVNGNGKTTTAAKLGLFLKNKGQKVRLVACDTFRAAAVEQLKIWGERLDIPVSSAADRSDPAALAYDAFTTAKKANEDTLIVDTAGRLHNRDDLMSELEKIKRTLGKQDLSAPHAVLLMVDGTTGQAAISQAKEFSSRIGVNGIIITKLDGTAKAGAIISLAKIFKLPVLAVGLGEQPEDIQSFSAQGYVEGLLNFK